MNPLTPGNGDLTNRVIAGYRVLHRLGRGGMSEVYLAFHEKLRRHIALKVLRQDLVNDPLYATRFLQEARAAASLVHPNIVQVYDIGQYETIHFIAQEYIAGSNLRAYIQRRGTLPLAETVSILLQASAALHKAASIGVVHRDIKPENILLTSDGEVKVADFGLAQARGQATNLTEVGITLGTPLYMSPEQIQGQTVDSRSDLYSLGVTAYHMLAGRAPFEGDTALALAVQHLQNPPPDLASFRPDLPGRMVKIVHRLLAKSPDDRFSSAAALSRDLREVAEELPGKWHGDQLLPLTDLVIEHDVAIATQTIRLQQVMIDERQERTRQRLWVGGLIGICLVLGMAGFAWGSRWRPAKMIPDPRQVVDQVPQQASVRDQYFLAWTKDSLPEWRAIEKYFPADQSAANLAFNLKAWLHIGRKCLEQKNAPEAEAYFKKILERFQKESDRVDRLVYVLALVGMMDVERTRDDRNAMERWKQEAQNYYGALNEEEKVFFNTQIPAHLLSLWQSATS